MNGQRKSVAILVYDNVEALDFVGPLEVFSLAGKPEGRPLFNVFTVAETPTVTTHNGLSVNPVHTLRDCPAVEVLVVPGGLGSRREMDNPAVLDWIRDRAVSAEMVLSVCTGALILAAAGLLSGLKATTHFGALDLLREMAPGAEVLEGVRYADNGRMILSAGIAAGIDASLQALARVSGMAAAVSTAAYMEYPWPAGS